VPHTYAIVGYRYRWPAKAVLEVLAVGTQLHLQAEPNHEVDPNAIKVSVDRDAIVGVTAIAGLKALYQVEWHALPPMIHLGYIPAELAALLKAEGFTTATGTFSVGANGGPKVTIGDIDG
jgi:hypothetical protein